MAAGRPLQEGDIVELRPDAPLPPIHRRLVPPGARGLVLGGDITPDTVATTAPREWATVVFIGHPIRIPQH